MTCSDKYKKNCPTGGTKVTAEEGDCAPRCIRAGCEAPLKGGDTCTKGHSQCHGDSAREMLGEVEELLQKQATVTDADTLEDLLARARTLAARSQQYATGIEDAALAERAESLLQQVEETYHAEFTDPETLLYERMLRALPTSVVAAGVEPALGGPEPLASPVHTAPSRASWEEWTVDEQGYIRQLHSLAGLTRVAPADVDGPPRCDHPGCHRPLLADGTCVYGHVQGRGMARAEDMAARVEERLGGAIARDLGAELAGPGVKAQMDRQLEQLNARLARPTDPAADLVAALETIRATVESEWVITDQQRMALSQQIEDARALATAREDKRTLARLRKLEAKLNAREEADRITNYARDFGVSKMEARSHMERMSTLMAERTLVDPTQVDGRPRCDHPGCHRPLRADGTCVYGHVQGQGTAVPPDTTSDTLAHHAEARGGDAPAVPPVATAALTKQQLRQLRAGIKDIETALRRYGQTPRLSRYTIDRLEADRLERGAQLTALLDARDMAKVRLEEARASGQPELVAQVESLVQQVEAKVQQRIASEEQELRTLVNLGLADADRGYDPHDAARTIGMAAIRHVADALHSFAHRHRAIFGRDEATVAAIVDPLQAQLRQRQTAMETQEARGIIAGLRTEIQQFLDAPLPPQPEEQEAAFIEALARQSVAATWALRLQDAAALTQLQQTDQAVSARWRETPRTAASVPRLRAAAARYREEGGLARNQGATAKSLYEYARAESALLMAGASARAELVQVYIQMGYSGYSNRLSTFDEAEYRFQQAHDLAVRIGSIAGQAEARQGQGWWATMAHRYTEALPLLQESRALWAQTGDGKAVAAVDAEIARAQRELAELTR